eukprot:159813_1
MESLPTKKIEWQINEPLLKQLLSTNSGQIFGVNKINIHDFTFQIDAYPNGLYANTTNGSFIISIRLFSISDSFQNITVTTCIECKELFIKQTSLTRFTENNNEYLWLKGTLYLSELKKSKKLNFTFTISIKILKMDLDNLFNTQYETTQNNACLLNKKQLIRWNINKNMMKIMEKSNEDKYFESNASHDGIWCLQWNPHTGALAILLCSIPTDVEQLTAKYSIECHELGYHSSSQHTFHFGHACMYAGVLSLNNVKHSSRDREITVTADIELIHVSYVNKMDTNLLMKSWSGKLINSKRTMIILYGFINQYHRLLTDDIRLLCLQYIGDDFCFVINSGQFKWIMNDKKFLKRIFLAANGVNIESKTFVINQLHWKLLAFPNGFDCKSRGVFSVAVKLLFMPKQFLHITVCLTIECKEIQSKQTKIIRIDQYQNNSVYNYLWNIKSLSDIHAIANEKNALTFVVKVSVLNIVTTVNSNSHLYQIQNNNYRLRQVLQWNICELQQLINGKTDAVYESENNGMWSISMGLLYFSSSYFLNLWLTLTSMPPNIESITIKYKIWCIETGKEYHGYADINYQNANTIAVNDVLSLMECELNDIKICAVIEVMYEYDLNWNNITIERTEAKWLTYRKDIDTNDKNVSISGRYKWAVDCMKLFELHSNLDVNNKVIYNEVMDPSLSIGVTSNKWKEVEKFQFLLLSPIFDVKGLKWMIGITDKC